MPQIYTGYDWRKMRQEEIFIMNEERVIKSKPDIPDDGDILMEEFKTMEIFAVIKMGEDRGYDIEKIFLDYKEAVSFAESAHDCRLEIIKLSAEEIFYEYSRY